MINSSQNGQEEVFEKEGKTLLPLVHTLFLHDKSCYRMSHNPEAYPTFLREDCMLKNPCEPFESVLIHQNSKGSDHNHS